MAGIKTNLKDLGKSFESMKESLHDEVEVNVCGLNGKMYSRDGGKKWCFQLGGFYNWFLPFNECLEKAEVQMIRVATLKINLKVKDIKKLNRGKY